MKTKKTLIILFFIVLLGGVLRFYKLGERPFINDEFFDVNSSYGYLKSGEFVAWDFNFGKLDYDSSYEERDERSWIYRWQVAQVLKFFPPTETTFRLVSAVWGIISIILLYFIGKYFTGKKYVGLIGAFIFAISYSGLLIDRRIRMYAMFMPVFLLFSWLFYRFFEEKYEGKREYLKKIQKRLDVNLKWLIPMLLAGALSFHLHDLTANIVPVFAVYCLIQTIIVFWKKGSVINKYSVVLAAFVFGFVAGKILLPDLVYEFAKQVKFFAKSYSYFSSSDYSFYVLACALIAFGVYFLAKKLNRPKELAWLASNFFVILFSAAFLWKRESATRYIFFIKSFEIILLSVGIYGVAHYFCERFSKIGNKTFVILILLMLLIIPSYRHFIKSEDIYGWYSRGEMNYRDVFDYIKKNKKEEDALITRTFRSYYWKDEKIPTFNLGVQRSNENFTAEQVKQAQSENKRVWVVITERDVYFIKKDAKKYVEENFKKVQINAPKGDGNVHLWENK